MSILKNIFRARKRKVVDLYSHLSRALFWDVDKKRLIEGEKAIKLSKGFHEKANRVGYLGINENVMVDVWKNGKPYLITGTIFEI